jgi:ketosteroid isomerase-like protein
MKSSIVITIFFSMFLLVNLSFANDVADVEKAVLAYETALREGDAETIDKHLDEWSVFWFSGSPLSEIEFNKDNFKTNMVDKGWKWNLRTRNRNIKVYDNAAIVTGYWVGSITGTSGSVSRGTRRFSWIWIKQGNIWKPVHLHESQLESLPRETITPTATNGQ